MFLRQEMTMAPPIIVFTVYGIEIPIRFRPKIKHAPPMSPMTNARAMIPRIVPTRRALLPFVFPSNSDIALMLFLYFI